MFFHLLLLKQTGSEQLISDYAQGMKLISNTQYYWFNKLVSKVYKNRINKINTIFIYCSSVSGLLTLRKTFALKEVPSQDHPLDHLGTRGLRRPGRLTGLSAEGSSNVGDFLATTQFLVAVLDPVERKAMIKYCKATLTMVLGNYNIFYWNKKIMIFLFTFYK